MLDLKVRSRKGADGFKIEMLIYLKKGLIKRRQAWKYMMKALENFLDGRIQTMLGTGSESTSLEI
jgi:hypothetical protein